MIDFVTAETVQLDIRGQICPSALLTALRQINTRKTALQRGAVQLVVLTDNRNATHTIPGAAANMGYDVEVVAEDGHYRITIRGRTPTP